jgi:hypothetical protein
MIYDSACLSSFLKKLAIDFETSLVILGGAALQRCG